jgi:hypothetical protein
MSHFTAAFADELTKLSGTIGDVARRAFTPNAWENKTPKLKRGTLPSKPKPSGPAPQAKKPTRRASRVQAPAPKEKPTLKSDQMWYRARRGRKVGKPIALPASMVPDVKKLNQEYGQTAMLAGPNKPWKK